MLDCNRYIRQRLSKLIRAAALILPVACAVLLMSQVTFAKNTYVISDGDTVLTHTTYASDPAVVLDEAGFRLGEDDIYTTQSSMGVSQITIQRQQVVGVVYHGQSYTATTYGQSVLSLLEELGIFLTEYDVLSCSEDAGTYDGMCISIDQCLVQEETYTEVVPFPTLYVLDKTLTPGAEKTVLDGVEGQLQNVDSVSYLNGSEVSRVSITKTTISQPTARLIAVGSLEGIPEEQIITPNADEQTGPQAILATGKLYIGDGLIVTADGQVLTYDETMQVKATAYTHTDPGCDMITATGTTVRVGTVAVDPRLIPYGTRMFIVTNDGKYIYGISVAEDCGGSIKGNRIDLYFETDPECWTFGVRNATIYFLG